MWRKRLWDKPHLSVTQRQHVATAYNKTNCDSVVVLLDPIQIVFNLCQNSVGMFEFVGGGGGDRPIARVRTCSKALRRDPAVGATALSFRELWMSRTACRPCVWGNGVFWAEMWCRGAGCMTFRWIAYLEGDLAMLLRNVGDHTSNWRTVALQ